MLTKEDLGQIREVVSEVVEASEKRVTENVTKTIIVTVGEMIDHNILPQFDELHEKFAEVKQEIRTLNAKVVTKGVLEDRLIDFKLSLSGARA